MADGAAVADRQATTSAAAAARPGLPAHLGRLPVTLSVELGRVRLAMRQVLELGAGTRLHVQRTRRRDLVVRVQDRALLSGSLVDREGRLAVRLAPVGIES